MQMHRLGRAAIFLAGSIIGGLALAFIIVFVHPQLLQRPQAPPPETANVLHGLVNQAAMDLIQR